jgi:D-3-phosphoglycerate dehydrogenase
MLKIRTLNNLAVAGLRRLPRDRYEVSSDTIEPDAIIVRSHDMHDMEIQIKGVLALRNLGKPIS